jgi:hypothetical protein
VSLLLQRIAVLGFAFKADTGDTRESASITLIRDFLSERAYVNIYDPKVTEAQIWLDLAEAAPNMSLDQSTYCLIVQACLYSFLFGYWIASFYCSRPWMFHPPFIVIPFSSHIVHDTNSFWIALQRY